MALAFAAASSQYATSTLAAVLPATNAAFYMGMWINIASFNPSDPNNIVGMDTTNFFVDIRTGGTVLLIGTFPGTTLSWTIAGWGVDEWHHLGVGYYRPSPPTLGLWRIYFDGTKVAESASPELGQAGGGTTLAFGYFPAVSARALNGRMTDIEVHNGNDAAFPDDSYILERARRFTPPVSRKLYRVAYWPMRNTSDLGDLVSGSSLSLTNSPTSYAHPPLIMPRGRRTAYAAGAAAPADTLFAQSVM